MYGIQQAIIPDIDPGPGVFTLPLIGGNDIYFLKLGSDTCASFYVTVDSVAGVSCSGTNGFANIVTFLGAAPYTYMWNTSPASTDTFAHFTQPGIYTVDAFDNIGCHVQRSVVIPGTILPGIDAMISVIPGQFRPGFPCSIIVDAHNNLCTQVSDQIKLVLDNQLHYVNSSVTPAVVSGDTLIWNYLNQMADSSHIVISVNVITDTFAVIGDQICLQAEINPLTGDVDIGNNQRDYCFPVVNGYDPNDKQVFPAGSCNVGLIEAGEKMTYMIRFQNTGNADAINIHVLDTLSPALDLSSLKVLSTSHACITEMLPGRVLNFKFDAIHLPYSTSDEPGSHGYIVYEVMQTPALAEGLPVRNTAYIYFDFNPVVVTNTVLSTITYDPDPGIFDDSVLVSGFTMTAQENHASYQWIDCNTGLPVAGANAQSFSPSVSGYYAVVLSSYDCVDTSTCYLVNSIDQYMVEVPSVKVFPNPGAGVFFINADLDGMTSVTLTDISGKFIFTRQLNGAKNSWIDIGDLAGGMYFVSVKFENGQCGVGSLVKQ